MRILILVPMLLLAACASGPTAVPTEAPSARTGTATAPTPAVIDAPADPRVLGAVDQLLIDARTLREAGDLPGSFARLERALRIAPERAEVYLELARNHATAGSASRAAAAAERGLLYCQGAVCGQLEALIGR
jgi:predicted Zn-dependent protease